MNASLQISPSFNLGNKPGSVLACPHLYVCFPRCLPSSHPCTELSACENVQTANDQCASQARKARASENLSLKPACSLMPVFPGHDLSCKFYEEIPRQQQEQQQADAGSQKVEISRYNLVVPTLRPSGPGGRRAAVCCGCRAAVFCGCRAAAGRRCGAAMGYMCSPVVYSLQRG